MRMHTRTFLCVVALLISTIAPLTHPFELDENSKPSYANSNDGFGPIEYTDQHTTASLVSEGREATLTMPGGHDNNHTLPLVIALHGYSSSGSFNAWWMSLYDSVHENEHLLLTPDGTLNWIAMRYWNATEACCNLFGSSVDDVVFLEGLISEAVANYGADPEGVILIGHSNGGFMTHRMACDRGNLIESIISLNGATWNDFNNDCPDTGRPNILHVHSTLDGVIQYDGGTLNGAQYPSAPQSTSFWAVRSGCDSSWTNLGTIDLTSSDGVAETDNLEHLNCADGNRVSHWRINNGSHAPSLNAPDWADQSLAWGLADFVRDSDGDGYRDDVDVFIYNPYEWADSDGDLVGDNSDEFPNDTMEWVDSDHDGVGDNTDQFPDNPLEWIDTDNDSIGDNADPDDDNDGWDDEFDAFSKNPLEWADTDNDGIGDNADPDDDNDGFNDDYDAFPQNPNEWWDGDGDGIGDNADLDDDGDGWTDDDENDCWTDPMNPNSIPNDADGDGDCDRVDPDDDNDGDLDIDDQFPFDSTEWDDSDGDGIGDNSDAFPEDSSESIDSDGDGVGDNSDSFPNNAEETQDSDDDGVGDNSDAFPQDSSENLDSDGDGIGDNADTFPFDENETIDSDGDGIGDNADLFPNDPNESVDADGDGVGDNADIFPEDPNESIDSDGDGVGDNADFYPFDESRWVEESSKIIILFPIGILLILGYIISRRRIKE